MSIGDGITNVVYNLSKELVRQGHEVSVYTSNSLDLNGESLVYIKNPANVNGVEVHYLDSLIRHRTFFVTPSLLSLLNRTISDFDIVHIHDLRSFQGVAAAFFARKFRIPFVYQSHGSFLSPLPRELRTRIMRLMLDQFVSRRSVGFSSRILALNRDEASRFVTQMGIPKEKISILPNGLDLEAFAECPHKGQFRKKLGIEGSAKVVLYVGRIHFTKGIDLILRAFSYLRHVLRCEEAMLLLVGPDGGFSEEARRLAHNLGIGEFVILPGFVSNQERHQALVDADLFVTPAYTGFPITFLEDCASGLPILTTTLGESLDWIDNVAGFVSDPTPESLANSMYSVLLDESLRAKLSQNCLNLARNDFSIQSITRKLVDIYQDVRILGGSCK